MESVAHLNTSNVDSEASTLSLPPLSPVLGQSQSQGHPHANGNGNGRLAVTSSPVRTTTAAGQKRRHSRPAAAYPRKRATKACHTCRFRRTKCDNARPACASCVRLGAECTYQNIDPSTFDPASLAILQRLDELEGLIQAKSDTNSQTTTLPALATRLESTSPSIPLSDLGSGAGDLRAQWKHSLINIEAVLQWPVFDEHEFPRRRYPVLGEEEDSYSEPAGLPISVDIDLPAAESLLRSYFDNVHIYNPILEEEDVREYMKMVCFNGVGWDAMSCLLLLIYAQGSIATPFVRDGMGISPVAFHQSPALRQAESYFLAAQKRMGMLLCRSGVIEAQCFFLAGVYLVTTLRPIEAWKMFVQALACCQGFLINNKPDDNGSEDEWNPKKRIYWTCFKSELELRLELNLAQKEVWDLTYPTFFPSPPDGLKTKDEAAWYFYLAEIALRRLGNRILSYLYKSDMSVSHESSIEHAILDFEEQTDTWLRSLPEMLSLDIPDLGNEQHEALRFILSGHFIDCQEMMYWYFVVDAIHGRLLGPHAELFVRKGLKVCVERICQNRRGFYYRHHGAWLMLRSCTRSAFVLLAAARRAELALFLPEGWREAVLDVAGMLRFWKDESRDVSEMLDVLETLLGG